MLSQFPLDAVLAELKSLNIDTVELGTGNCPSDPHCKLSMLEDAAALAEFQRLIADHGATIAHVATPNLRAPSQGETYLPWRVRRPLLAINGRRPRKIR